jgi:hypothetical protein
MANTRVNTDYKSLKSWLSNGRGSSKMIANNTIATLINDKIEIALHGTVICTIESDKIMLSSGGWKTLTTKERINSFLPYPFRVYQEKNTWYLWDYKTKNKYLFEDGIEINLNDNTISGEGKLSDKQETDKLRKQIKKYVKSYITELFNGNVSAPDSGDCWYCLMITDTDEPLGEAIKDKSHIISHLDENYYVPSLLRNAINNYPVSQVAKWILSYLWYKTDSNIDYLHDLSKDQLSKSLYKYICQQMGI